MRKIQRRGNDPLCPRDGAHDGAPQCSVLGPLWSTPLHHLHHARPRPTIRLIKSSSTDHSMQATPNSSTRSSPALSHLPLLNCNSAYVANL